MAPAIQTLSTTKNKNRTGEVFYVSSIGLNLAPPRFNLSRYFPKGTQYFYGYPSGDDSRFFNNVPPAHEELVAARSLVCAGGHVRPIVFASSMENDRIRSLREEMGMATVKLDQVLTLPSHITHHIFGKERNTLIKSALKEISHTGKLIMAQPFLDPELQNSYQIRPELTILLNDKKNLPVYIPQEYLSERYAEYPNGHSFAEFSRHIPVPCVVKVSSSSSGNGVRICRTALELENVRKEYVAVSGTIIVEKMIEVARNFGIQFGIPFDPTMSMEIIGVSEQLTTPEGEFIGGIIDPQKVPPEIEHMQKVLLDRVLPIIRNMGWYGIGGFDVLIDTNGQSFITDPNFRMTGMTAYLCQIRNGSIRTPMMSFSGTFKGTEEEFRQHIMPLATEGASHQMLHVIALTRHEDMFYINAAMLFNPQKYSLQKNARQLTGLGLESRALRMLGTSRA